MRFVKKMLWAIFLMLVVVFIRLWDIGYNIPRFLQVGSQFVFVIAILIVIDAVIEDFVKDKKDKE